MNSQSLEDTVVNGSDETFVLGELVGGGAEGEIYRVQGAPDRVVKIFYPKVRDRKEVKIRTMISEPPTDPTYEKRDFISIVWPTGIVTKTETDSFLGYQMPYKNANQHKNTRLYAREDLTWDESDTQTRYITAYNLASVVDAIHKQGHAIGDLNHQNILVKNGYISLIDCDSFHIAGPNDTHRGKTVSRRYTPPEGRKPTIKAVRLSDRFGLSVHIFQLLMEGFHPYQALGEDATGGEFIEIIKENPFPYPESTSRKIEPHPQAPSYEELPTSLRDLVETCFVDGKSNPRTRPSASDWKTVLKGVIDVSPAQIETDSAKTDLMSAPESVSAGKQPNESGSTSVDNSSRPTVENPTNGTPSTKDPIDWGTTPPSKPSNTNSAIFPNIDLSSSASEIVHEVKRIVITIGFIIFFLLVFTLLLFL